MEARELSDDEFLGGGVELSDEEFLGQPAPRQPSGRGFAYRPPPSPEPAPVMQQPVVRQPAEPSMTAIEESPWEAVVNPFRRGYREGEVRDSLVTGLAIGSSPQDMGERVRELTRRAGAIPRAPAVEEGMKAISEAQGPWNAFKEIVTHPRAIYQTLGESIGGQVVPAATSMAAGVLGPLGMAAGTFVGSTGTEFASALLEEIQDLAKKSGRPLNDGYDWARVLEDPAIMDAAKKKAAIRAPIIGSIDAATAGIAGRWLRQVMGKQASVGQWAGAIAKEAGSQTGGGMLGEWLAQLPTEDKLKWGDIFMEGFAELPTTVHEAGTNVAAYRETQPDIQLAKALRGEPVIDPALLNRRPDAYWNVDVGPLPPPAGGLVTNFVERIRNAAQQNVPVAPGGGGAPSWKPPSDVEPPGPLFGADSSLAGAVTGGISPTPGGPGAFGQYGVPADYSAAPTLRGSLPGGGPAAPAPGPAPDDVAGDLGAFVTSPEGQEFLRSPEGQRVLATPEGQRAREALEAAGIDLGLQPPGEEPSIAGAVAPQPPAAAPAVAPEDDLEQEFDSYAKGPPRINQHGVPVGVPTEEVFQPRGNKGYKARIQLYQIPGKGWAHRGDTWIGGTEAGSGGGSIGSPTGKFYPTREEALAAAADQLRKQAQGRLANKYGQYPTSVLRGAQNMLAWLDKTWPAPPPAAAPSEAHAGSAWPFPTDVERRPASNEEKYSGGHAEIREQLRRNWPMGTPVRVAKHERLGGALSGTGREGVVAGYNSVGPMVQVRMPPTGRERTEKEVWVNVGQPKHPDRLERIEAPAPIPPEMPRPTQPAWPMPGWQAPPPRGPAPAPAARGKAAPAAPPEPGIKPKWTNNRDAVLDLLRYRWQGDAALTAKKVGEIQGDMENFGRTLGTKKAKEILDGLVAEGLLTRKGSKYSLVEQPPAAPAPEPAPAPAVAKKGKKGKVAPAPEPEPEPEEPALPGIEAGQFDMSPEERAEFLKIRAIPYDDRTPEQQERHDELEEEYILWRREHLFDEPDETVRAADKANQAGEMSQAEADRKKETWKATARAQRGNTNKTVLSLFDFTGEWTKPWEEAGYNVVRVDIKNGQDLNDLTSIEHLDNLTDGGYVDVVLAACPCTDFAASGARWWAGKDADGITKGSIELVKRTLAIIEYLQPDVWAIENPVGRIQSLAQLPDPRLIFQPHHYGDPYTKKTLLYGNFNPDLPQANVHPAEGSKMHKMSSSRQAERSITPEGFAYSFFMANGGEGYSALQPAEPAAAPAPKPSKAASMDQQAKERRAQADQVAKHFGLTRDPNAPSVADLTFPDGSVIELHDATGPDGADRFAVRYDPGDGGAVEHEFFDNIETAEYFINDIFHEKGIEPPGQAAEPEPEPEAREYKAGDRVKYASRLDGKTHNATVTKAIVDRGKVVGYFVHVDGEPESQSSTASAEDLEPSDAPAPAPEVRGKAKKETQERREKARSALRSAAARAKKDGHDKLARRLDYLSGLLATSNAGAQMKKTIEPALAQKIADNYEAYAARAAADPDDEFTDVNSSSAGNVKAPKPPPPPEKKVEPQLKPRNPTSKKPSEKQRKEWETARAAATKELADKYGLEPHSHGSSMYEAMLPSGSYLSINHSLTAKNQDQWGVRFMPHDMSMGNPAVDKTFLSIEDADAWIRRELKGRGEPVPDNAPSKVSGVRPQPTTGPGPSREEIGSGVEGAPNTKSKEFKAFFGDSKVTDEKNRPLVVYRGEHGESTGDFHSRSAQSLTFSTREAANTYATDPNDRRDTAHSPRVIPVYLRIENPIIENLDDPFVELRDLARQLGRTQAERIAAKFFPDIQETGAWQDDWQDTYAKGQFKTFEAFLKAHPGAFNDLYFDAYKLLDDDEEVAKFKEQGYDGAIHVGNGVTAGEMEYRVFDRDQIRSAFSFRPDDGKGKLESFTLKELDQREEAREEKTPPPGPEDEALYDAAGLTDLEDPERDEDLPPATSFKTQEQALDVVDPQRLTEWGPPTKSEADQTRRSSNYLDAWHAAGVDPAVAQHWPYDMQLGKLSQVWKARYGITVKTHARAKTHKVIDSLLDGYRNAGVMMGRLGLPQSFLSLGGQLKLTMETLNKGYLGAFTPATMEIHMPDRSNSFAHEWGHALDHWIFRKWSLKSRVPFTTMVAAKGGLPGADIDPVMAAYAKVMQAIFYDQADLAGRMQQLQITASETVKDGPNKGKPTPSAKKAQREINELVGGSAMYAGKGVQPSEFLLNAGNLDGMNKKLYWQMPYELKARSFEAYVAHIGKIAGSVDSDEFITKGDATYLNAADEFISKAYPQKERDAIFAAYTELFAALADAEAVKNSSPDVPPHLTEVAERDPVLDPHNQEALTLKTIVRDEIEPLVDAWQAAELRIRNRGGILPAVVGETKDLASSIGNLSWELYHQGLAPMRSWMDMMQRRSGSPTLAALNKQLFRNIHVVGDRKQARQTTSEAIRMHAGGLMNKIHAEVRRLGFPKKGLTPLENELLREVMTAVRTSTNEDVREALKKSAARFTTLTDQEQKRVMTLGLFLRQVLGDQLYYMEDAGVDIGATLYGYLPRNLDKEAVFKAPEKFKRQAAKVYGQIFDTTVGTDIDNWDEKAWRRALHDLGFRWKGRKSREGRPAVPASDGKLDKHTAALVRQVGALLGKIKRLERKWQKAEDEDEKADIQAQIDQLREEQLEPLIGEMLAALRPDYGLAHATAWLEALRVGDPGMFDALGPLSNFKNRRALPIEADKLMADFYNPDVVDSVQEYIERSTRRAEFARVFGDDMKKFEEMLYAMTREGVNEQDIAHIKQIVHTVTGRQNHAVPTGWNDAMNWVQTAMTFRLLSRSAFASLAEPIQQAGITGRSLDVIRAFTTILDPIIRKADYRQRQELARMMGLITPPFMSTGLHNRISGESMGKKQAKFMQTFFERSLLAPLTRWQRQAAVKGYHEFLIQLVKRLDDKGTRAELEQWGIPVADQPAFAKWLLSHGGAMPNVSDIIDPRTRRPGGIPGYYASAISAMVSHTITEPDKIDKPMLAHNPTARAMWAIQGFQFGHWAKFYKPMVRKTVMEMKTIYGRARPAQYKVPIEDLNDIDMNGLQALGDLAGRIFVTATSIYTMTLMSTVVREFLFNRDRWEEEEKKGNLLNWLAWLAATRANIFGPADLFIQAVAGLKYQRDLTSFLSGPYNGTILQNMSDIIKWVMGSTTGPAAKHKAMKAIYLTVVGQMLGWAQAAMPGGRVLGLGYAGANAYFGSNTAAAKAAEMVGAPKPPKRGKSAAEKAEDPRAEMKAERKKMRDELKSAR